MSTEVALESPHGEVPLAPVAPYIIVYDTMKNEVVGYHSWDKPVSLTVFKAAFVKAVEDHGDAYGADINRLMHAADGTAKALGQKKSKFPPEMGYNMVQRCQGRIEEVWRRMAEYQGGYGTELTVLLPFCETATSGEAPNEVIDFAHTKPFNNGWLFTAVYRDEYPAKA